MWWPPHPCCKVSGFHSKSLSCISLSGRISVPRARWLISPPSLHVSSYLVYTVNCKSILLAPQRYNTTTLCVVTVKDNRGPGLGLRAREQVARGQSQNPLTSQRFLRCKMNGHVIHRSARLWLSVPQPRKAAMNSSSRILDNSPCSAHEVRGVVLRHGEGSLSLPCDKNSAEYPFI